MILTSINNPDIDYRTHMRRFQIILAVLLCLFVNTAIAEIKLVPESKLVPETKYELVTELITHIIETYHYKNKPLNDSLSSLILDKYLDSLDPNRSYFFDSDIKSFEKYRDKLDDALRQQDLSPAYEIFKKYRTRVDERVKYAIELLSHNYNFDKDEDFIFDRRDLPWPSTQAEMNEIWRKRVKNDILNLRLAKKDKAEYKSTLEKRYKRIRTSTFQLNSNDVFQTFINAYTTSIEPHTAYFSPRVSENFDISMRLSLEGIGAVLTSDNDYTVIQDIVPGGPADLSKQLHSDDMITGVGQGPNGEIVDVIGWRLDDVVDLIRGPKDTIVRLEILPKGSGPAGPNKIITLTRNKIKLEEQAAKSSIIDIPDTGKRIGVIDVPTFYIDFAAQARGDKNYKSTSRDVRKLIAELKKQDIEGLIIDLRGNGGGSLSEALELTGLFIKEGPIVQTKDSTGQVEINNDPDPGIVYSGPLAVLVDRNSASASEIFAGAIQDYQRGVIIGEPTFGKGTVQNVVDLNRFIRNSDDDHGRLKTTIAQFFRISGGSNQFKGVIPDIIYPTAKNASEYGERSLPNALPWDHVKPAKFTKVNAPIDKVAKIENKYEARIKSDKAFQLLMKEMQLVEKATENKKISLMESKRIKERDQLLNTKRELENQLRIAHGLAPIPENADLSEVENDEDEDKTDVLLNETALILNDLINIAYNQPAGLKAVQQNSTPGINNNL